MTRCLLLGCLCLASASGSSPLCPFTKCGGKMWACARDAQCRSAIGCVMGCAKVLPQGGQIAFGGCVQACTMQKPSDDFKAITKCIFDNKCVDSMPFPMTAHCKKPQNAKPIGLKNLEGLWWNVYGYDKTADCQKCQFRSWYPKPNSNKKWIYDDNTLVVDGNNQYFNFTYPNECDASLYEPKDSMTFYWGEELGMGFKEEWWLLDESPQYMQVYYCLTDLKLHPGHQAEGGVILSRSKSIPESALPKIAEVYKPYYDFSSLCKNDNSCPSGPAQSEAGSLFQVVV